MNEDKGECEICEETFGEYHCENGNCNKFCCSDCFGDNYCINCKEYEKE